MKISRKQAIVSSLLFMIIFPIPWIWFTERILDNIFPSNFNWYCLPIIMVMILPVTIYLLDKESDNKTKIINSIISLLIMILVLIIFLGIAMLYYSYAMGRASHAIT